MASPQMKVKRQSSCNAQTSIFLQLSQQEKGLNSMCYKVLEKKSRSALQFLMSDGSSWPDLQQIAVKVFSMATSSAASERNFSTFGFLHQKKEL